MIHVLCVDDEPLLLTLCRRYLERTGEFTVETADSGEEALARLGEGEIDVVVSDYQMPGMNGIELLSAIRRQSPIPFILFTGRGREEVVIEALNRGVDFYLQKGGDPRAQFAELGSKCRQAVARRSAERAVRESRELVRALLDAFPGVALLIEPDGRLLAANKAAFHAWSAIEEDCVGRSIFDLMGAPVEIGRRSAIEEAVRAGRPTQYRDVRHGRTQDALITPIAGPDGTVKRVAVFSMDITEQETGETALRTAAARVRALLEVVPQALVLADIDGMILDLNGSAAALFGRPFDDLLGRRLGEMEPLERRVRLEKAFEEVVRTGQPTRCRQAFGGAILDCTLQPLRGDGGEVHEVAVVVSRIAERDEESP
ncbi:MAG: response regulator [Methanoregulaceae archaeon]